jgi:hypothetical protein
MNRDQKREWALNKHFRHHDEEKLNRSSVNNVF